MLGGHQLTQKSLRPLSAGGVGVGVRHQQDAAVALTDGGQGQKSPLADGDGTDGTVVGTAAGASRDGVGQMGHGGLLGA